MIYATSVSIQEMYQKMQFEPRRWLKNELTPIEKEVLVSREILRLSLIKKGWVFPMLTELKSQLVNLMDSANLGLLPPTLKPPLFFSQHLTNDLKSSLKELLKDHPRLIEINILIENAMLDLSSPEFYTLPRSTGYVIRGNNKPTYGNLICFAHELGHALYELDHPTDELGSESAAFIFEDQIAMLLLTSDADHKEWTNYKRAQDELNYFLCINEFQEFETGYSCTPKNYLFFRESLVTCWGYQCINAWASLQREVSARSIKDSRLTF